MDELPSTNDRLDATFEKTAREFREAVAARRELLNAELQLDAHTCKQLAIKLCCAIVMLSAGLAILLMLLANWLDGRMPETSLPSWTLVIGCGMIAGSGVLIGLAVKKFVRDFLGLRNTIAELEEDAVWISETLDERFSS